MMIDKFQGEAEIKNDIIEKNMTQAAQFEMRYRTIKAALESMASSFSIELKEENFANLI